MAFITRQSDNIEFVIKPVREDSTASTRSQILKEIRTRSKEYGDFCHVRRIDEGYTITFNQDQGYLLGESIARHFDYPKNLIWCENIGEDSEGEARVAIVIVRNHRIMLDAEMPATAVADDISMSIGGGDESFDVYTYGDVPIKASADVASFNDVVLETARTSQFVHLNDAVLDLVVPNKHDYLTTPAAAVANAGFTNSTWKYVVATAVVAAGAYWGLIYEEPKKRVVTIDNYQSYKVALQSISPSNALLTIANDYGSILSLDSWFLSQVTIDNSGSFTYALSSTDPDFAKASEFAEQIDAEFSLNKDSVQLSRFLPIEMARPEINVIAPLDEITVSVLDQISVSPYVSVSLGDYSTTGHYKLRTAKLQLQSIAYPELIWLASLLDGTASTLNNGTLNIERFGISGELNLTIYGY